MKAKPGTYLVEFIDGVTFVTGNNYKPWWQHSIDYFYRVYRDKNRTSGRSLTFSTWSDIVKVVKYSDTPYVDDGGLKWATPDAYQEVIEEMYSKDKVRRPQYAEINFIESPLLTRKLKKEMQSL